MRTRLYVSAALLVALAVPDMELSAMQRRRFATRPEKPMPKPPQKRVPVTPPEETPDLVVRFTSVPAGADVLIDGEYWGTTPTAAFTKLAVGKHQVVVKKSGYISWEQTITVAHGDERTIQAELAVKPYDPTKPRITGN